MTEGGQRGLEGELLVECAGWIWEQLQEEGFFLAGELVELVLTTERDMGIQGERLQFIAETLEAEFEARGVVGNPYPVNVALILAVLSWEDEFLGYAGIPRAES